MFKPLGTHLVRGPKKVNVSEEHMEGRDRGIVCLGKGSEGKQQKTAETKETYGAFKVIMLYFSHH